MNEMVSREKQNSQSGQVLVEYVLFLVIAVALILGLAQQLYKPFGTWVHDYMGEYVSCLLDVGELPSLGVNDSDGECTVHFKPYSVAGGRPRNSQSLSSNKDSSNDSSSKSPKEKLRSSKESGNSSSGGGSSSASRGSPRTISSRQSTDGRSSEDNSKKIVEKLPESQFFKSRTGSSSSSSSGTPSKTIIVAGNPNGIYSEENKNGEKRVIVNNLEAGDSNSQAKKFTVKPPERKPANEDEDKPWSFSEYIKWALILVIIIAIILFLAGQVMQISKSMEK